MSDLDLYSDRTRRPVPRNQDELPDNTRTGLVNYVVGLINQHWFAERFPEECRDGNNVCGTLVGNLLIEIEALIPGIQAPLNADRMSDLDVFDLLEYTYRSVSRPKREMRHDFLNHWELSFDRKPARREFREQINHMLARGGANYELDTGGQIQRRGSGPVRLLIDGLRPVTDDDELNDLIHYATRLYISKNPQQRQDGLEKLWDGYERLKSLRHPGRRTKQRSVEALLSVIEPPELRAVINEEMGFLTKIGNDFRIRHSEVDKTSIPDSARDYFFTRMGDLLMYILGENGWLLDDPDKQVR
ncbi:hypothetical protein AB0G00_32355 [Nocardia salmonicida]|uniref:hypothetical protein n=1 Tax=Nocardia salmonicida TaxID=53431 RepID=UPI0033D3C202